MQFVGIGLPELLLILVLTVIVVGPERLPEAAAQLARWIRQARAYAQFVARDFNEVIGELEKEVGTSREDFKEIATVLNRNTSAVFEEIDKAGKEVREAADLEKAAGAGAIPLTDGASANGQASNAAESTALKEAAMAGEPPPAEPARSEAPETGQAVEQEWFVPTRGRRRRPQSDAS